MATDTGIYTHAYDVCTRGLRQITTIIIVTIIISLISTIIITINIITITIIIIIIIIIIVIIVDINIIIISTRLEYLRISENIRRITEEYPRNMY